jgi:hypothetical protein
VSCSMSPDKMKRVSVFWKCPPKNPIRELA